MFALLLLSATASALPASHAGARPKPTAAAKFGRRASTAKGNQAATRPTPMVSKAASKPTAKPASPSGKRIATSNSAPARSSLGGSSAVPVSKVLAAPAENEAPAPSADDPDRARILGLQEALTRIVHGSVLGRLRVGMRVLDLATGHVLFSQRGSVLMDPASNQKVLATATALLRLGSTWRFRTELSGSPPGGDGTIAGDLILRGSGDPSLRGAHLDAMAEELARRGVTRVEGRVLGDPRRIGSDEAAVAGRSPVRVGWAAIEIHVRPGDKVGASALASLRPGSDSVRLVNQAVTGKGAAASACRCHALANTSRFWSRARSGLVVPASWSGERRPVTRCTRRS